jgi:hypothetical protein
MRVHGEPRYLLSESLVHFKNYAHHHPFLAGVILLALYGGVMAILKWTFEEIEPPTFVFGLVITAILLLVGAAAYTYLHVPGYHFGG